MTHPLSTSRQSLLAAAPASALAPPLEGSLSRMAFRIDYLPPGAVAAYRKDGSGQERLVGIHRKRGADGEWVHYMPDGSVPPKLFVDGVRMVPVFPIEYSGSPAEAHVLADEAMPEPSYGKQRIPALIRKAEQIVFWSMEVAAFSRLPPSLLLPFAPGGHLAGKLGTREGAAEETAALPLLGARAPEQDVSDPRFLFRHGPSPRRLGVEGQVAVFETPAVSENRAILASGCIGVMPVVRHEEADGLRAFTEFGIGIMSPSGVAVFRLA